jgi:hypothetical protein
MRNTMKKLLMVCSAVLAFSSLGFAADKPNPDKLDKCVNEIIFLPKSARNNF